ncbi:hypothetical protein E9565_03580 [Blastococcus sp. KM273129]|nr:hypothetical protein [Blastococcus sp. KM273129]
MRAADVAGWLLKSARPPPALDAGWLPGTARELARCVRRSYRLDLVAAGQPVLLWVSGRVTPGVHAVGRVTGPVGETADGPVVPVRLLRLDAPVGRAELRADPEFADAEVLRMPAGSNPSWLSAAQLSAVLDRIAPGQLGRWLP